MLNKKRVASLWKRLFAYMIDAIIVSFIIIVPLKAFKIDEFSATWSDPETWMAVSDTSQPFGEVFKIGIIAAALTILYWALMEYYIKQTIGKMIFRLEVQSTKKKLTFTQCVVRNITKISGVVLFFDVVYLLIKRTHQRYFEKLSNTEVVRK